jgi:hypothetical protein
MTDSLRVPLGAVAAVGILVGLLPVLWIIRRLFRGMFEHEQVPVSLARYVLALVTGALFLGAGLAALGLSAALQGWQAFTAKTHAAEVQCIELGPSKLRLYYVPIEPDGTRGATETYDLDGDEWQVGGDILRFRPFLTTLGVKTVFHVTRVEGRWIKATDASAHKPTAFDRAGGTSAGWLALYRDGGRGPMQWLVAGAHGQSVSQLPDRRAIYDLYVTPNGFVIDKRSL